MELSTIEKIKVIMKRKNMTLVDLANATGQSSQNLSNKFRRDKLNEAEIKELAEAMGCTAEVVFRFPDGETL